MSNPHPSCGWKRLEREVWRRLTRWLWNHIFCVLAESSSADHRVSPECPSLWLVQGSGLCFMAGFFGMLYLITGENSEPFIVGEIFLRGKLGREMLLCLLTVCCAVYACYWRQGQGSSSCLSAAQMACLAQLLISVCLILAVTASRLSAHCVWIIVSCTKSMGFLRSPEKSLFSSNSSPLQSPLSDESVTSVCGRSVGLFVSWYVVLNVIGLLWSSCGISLPTNPLVRIKAPLGTWTGLEGLWQLKMIQRHTGDSHSQLLSRSTARWLQLLFFYSSPFPQSVPAPLFSAPLVNSLKSLFFPCATFHPRYCLFCLLHHELKWNCFS